jgi:hypothetical protein
MSATGREMHALACHPATPTTAVRRVDAAAILADGGALALRYVLAADMARLEVPQPRAPRRADGLWRHTCFECFVRGVGSAYLELNFSPSGEWAAYAFDAYREPAPLPAAFDPRIAVSVSAEALELVATVPAEALPRAARRRIGLSAVVEETSGAIAYWALRHAPGKPDFHHEDAFALEV